MAYQDPRKADPTQFIPGELLVKSSEMEWKPYSDVSEYKLLNINEVTGQWVTLDRHKAGAQLNGHLHKGAIEGFVMSGKFTYRGPDRLLEAGDYFYEPLGALHPGTECVEAGITFAIYHGALEFLDDDGNTVSILDWEWFKRHQAGLEPATVF